MRSAVAVVVAATAVVGGCGHPASLDVEAVERTVGARLDAAHGYVVDRVDCPDEIEVERGATFTCTVALARSDGASVRVEVRQVDGEGRLAVEPVAAVLVAADVEADVEEVLADRFSRDDATVTCPGPEVRVEEPGASFTCEARDGSERRSVEVRVRDAQGALTYTLD